MCSLQTAKHTPYTLWNVFSTDRKAYTLHTRECVLSWLELKTVDPKPGTDAHGQWTESAVCEAPVWQPFGKGDVKDDEGHVKDGQNAEEGDGFEVP